jgi:hypothetical protein
MTVGHKFGTESEMIVTELEIGIDVLKYVRRKNIEAYKARSEILPQN